MFQNVQKWEGEQIFMKKSEVVGWPPVENDNLTQKVD
jgi:hypothetical protein